MPIHPVSLPTPPPRPPSFVSVRPLGGHAFSACSGCAHCSVLGATSDGRQKKKRVATGSNSRGIHTLPSFDSAPCNDRACVCVVSVPVPRHDRGCPRQSPARPAADHPKGEGGGGGRGRGYTCRNPPLPAHGCAAGQARGGHAHWRREWAHCTASEILKGSLRGGHWTDRADRTARHEDEGRGTTSCRDLLSSSFFSRAAPCFSRIPLLCPPGSAAESAFCSEVLPHSQVLNHFTASAVFPIAPGRRFQQQLKQT